VGSAAGVALGAAGVGDATGAGEAGGVPGRRIVALAGIGAIALAGAAAFAWTAGWIGPERLTSQRFLDTMEAGGPAHPGFRRAHPKGVCVSGRFFGTAGGRALSSAEAFAGEPVAVTGRLSIGGGDPHGDDATARVRSLALQLGGRGETQWRMAMNSFPFMAVATPREFHRQLVANAPDPATGKPDPAAVGGIQGAPPRAPAVQAGAK
jgi:catalase